MQQQPRRDAEQQARRAAVQFVAEQVPSCRRAARCYLKLAPRTLATWRRRSARGELTAPLRGRPVREPTREEREVVTAVLEETCPRLGVPALQACFPETPRCVLTYLLGAYRRQFQVEHQQVLETLHWQRPGAVWAIDHSQPPRPINGCYEQILAVRDLASGHQLAWTAVHGATASEALAVLESLVRAHGPPLVLKSDNGSAFISDDFGAWLDRWQVVPLLSPVRMPRFNGACEAGIGAAKRRTECLALRHGRAAVWSLDDLEAARLWSNEDHYPGGYAAGTPAHKFTARKPIDTTERDVFSAAVAACEHELQEVACTAGEELTDSLLAAYHRRAVRQVLVDQSHLVITRRSIPQLIPGVKCATIT